jgi:hypothetical protein
VKLFGFGATQFLKIGLAAAIFILGAKWLVPKARVPALTQTVERI